MAKCYRDKVSTRKVLIFYLWPKIDKGVNRMILNNILKKREINSLISTDRWLSIKQIIEYSGLSDSTIRRAIRKGVLKAGNRGGKLLFKKENIDSWIKGY